MTSTSDDEFSDAKRRRLEMIATSSKSASQRSASKFQKTLTETDFGIYDGAVIVMGKDENMSTFGNVTIGSLPNELLEEIFCHLPTADLFSNCTLVCRRFTGLISEENYLRWKKLYLRYLKKEAGAVQRVDIGIRSELAPDGQPAGIKELIGYISTTFTLKNEELKNALLNHGAYRNTVSIVANIKNSLASAESDLGALIATLILTSDGVPSMLKIIKLLTAQRACSTVYWIEYFYCLLTLLWAYSSNWSVLSDQRLHFELQYALYLFENSGGLSSEKLSSKVSGESVSNGQTSSPPSTYEQQRIISFDLQPHDCVRVVGYAGTGKTTTLIKYCEARPDKEFLVIFFGNAVAFEAKMRFPKNAECRTIHSLAYEAVGQWYKDKTKYKGGISVDEIIKLCPDIEGLDSYVRARLIHDTLSYYFTSDLACITKMCVPETWRVPDENQHYVTQNLPDDLRDIIFEQAKTTWEAMKDLGNEKIEMIPDGYLKLYQLSKPRIVGYYAILVDEAQDSNPVTLDIVLSQDGVPKMLVGDNCQQIYSFRGAINVLQNIPATTTLYLTQSFRFGPDIALVANTWMRSVLGQTKFLIGTDRPSRLDGHVEGQLAVICRTNFGVFKECVAIADQKRCLCIGNGGMYAFDFGLLEAVYYLYLSKNSQKNVKDGEPRHWLLKKYNSFADVKDYANKVSAKEILSMISIVEVYKLNTVDRIRSIKSCLVSNPRRAEFVVTTAHKSKGLEYATVRLSKSFFADQDQSNFGWSNDEFNAVYVAITRATTSLIMNETVYRVLARKCGPAFFFKPSFSTGQNESCGLCSCELNIGTVFLKRKSLAITFVDAAGSLSYLDYPTLCKQCVSHIVEDPALDIVHDLFNEISSPAKVGGFGFYCPILR